MKMHDDEVDLDLPTVRRLIAEQFPQWSALPVRPVDTAATVNAIYRIGDELAARFPLRWEEPEEVRGSLRAEAEAAREFAEAAAAPTPVPVALGEPGHGYPMPWSIQTWLAGHDATVEDPAGSLAFGRDLARLLMSLRAADTRGRTFAGSGRGGHLPDHDAWLDECFSNSEHLLDVPRLRAMWAELRRLPRVGPDVMCHGDLTPPNVLVQGGRLAGVLDAGGFAPADPALDLVACWHLLDAGSRRVVQEALACDEVEWGRGKAWAFQQAMGLVWYYAETNPAMSSWGRRTLERLLDDADQRRTSLL